MRPIRRALLLSILVLAACGDDDDGGAARDTAGSTTTVEVDDPASFADPASKLSYTIPDGWFGPATEDLVAFFTSTISSNEPNADTGDEPAAIAGAGLFDTTFFDPSVGLQEAATGAAFGFAEFFVPYPGQREVEIDEATEVSGREAWHLRFRVVPDDPDNPAALVAMIAVELPEPAYVVAVVIGDDPTLEADVEAVIASVGVG